MASPIAVNDAASSRKRKINNKVQYCGAFGCSQSRENKPGVSLFGFPKPGKDGRNAKEQLESYEELDNFIDVLETAINLVISVVDSRTIENNHDDTFPHGPHKVQLEFGKN
ncbi:hypothetical protein CAPTEDRAFT_206057 [Capitella teleta]|uniref:Uncharacterized protein n=1 Tax=Capitella teleta TaxID=283909 RepID=R7URN2_CAPTE|nr:hypothetical protein CAPTEDRAFT_206057 [Capitella teleta]|eukprot:ELU08870.1 hypothetical protein CAPTEDRAFT_206057 [Capitella teleta]